jgi:hypothetical protein
MQGDILHGGHRGHAGKGGLARQHEMTNAAQGAGEAGPSRTANTFHIV